MKKTVLVKSLITSFMVMASLFATTAAFAMAGMPSQPPGAPPRGLAIEGAVSGTKLTGTIAITFDNFFCTDSATANYASASGTVRLRKAGGNFHESGNNTIVPFPFSGITVPIDNPGVAQYNIITALTPAILKAFFGVDSGMAIYTKDVNDYVSTLIPATDFSSPCKYFTYYDPSTFEEKMFNSFNVMADVVLAVK